MRFAYRDYIKSCDFDERSRVGFGESYIYILSGMLNMDENEDADRTNRGGEKRREEG